MTIAIATPTGNIGGRITKRLMEAGAKITVLVRHPDKLDDAIRQYATVQQGSLDDVEFVVKATRGVEALFWLTPYNFGTNNLRGWQDRLGNSAMAAVRANGISYVVNLSSNGAHLAEGMGPISGLYDVEQKLDRVAPNILHLRPGFFMENYLWYLESIQKQSKIFMLIPGDRRMAMIATRDIAEIIAKRLLNLSWSGRSVLGLHGPADLSFNEAAAIIGRELEMPISHIEITLEQFHTSMLEQGATQDVANQYIEMWQALSREDYSPAEPRTEETTTPTTLAQFVHETVLPIMTA